MGVLYSISKDDSDWSLYGANIPERCFTCGEQLCFPMVYWAGCNGDIGQNNGSQIWLHADCAKELGLNLMLDARKAINNTKRLN